MKCRSILFSCAFIAMTNGAFADVPYCISNSATPGLYLYNGSKMQIQYIPPATVVAVQKSDFPITVTPCETLDKNCGDDLIIIDEPGKHVVWGSKLKYWHTPLPDCSPL